LRMGDNDEYEQRFSLMISSLQPSCKVSIVSSLPLGTLIPAAAKVLSQAQRFSADQLQLPMAYVFYKRFLNLYATSITAHPEFRKAAHQDALLALKASVRGALDEAEGVKKVRAQRSQNLCAVLKCCRIPITINPYRAHMLSAP
jgi:hypothetical protein